MRGEGRTLLLAATFLAVVGSAACRGGGHSTTEVRRAFLGPILREDTRAYVVVRNFKKLNGVRRKDGVYVAECSYEVVFKVSARQMAEVAAAETQRFMEEGLKALGAGSIAGVGGIARSFDTTVAGVSSWLLLGDFPAGHRVKFDRSIPFEITDNGLRVVGAKDQSLEELDEFPVSRILRSGLLDVGGEAE